MKKEILIITPSFKHGGTNRSLFNFLSLVAKSGYRIDVFSMNHYGHYKEILPNCRILSEDIIITALTCVIKEEQNKIRKILFTLIRILRKLGKYLHLDFTQLIYFISAKKFSNKYDTVVAFQEGNATFFASSIKSNNLIAWIRCDYLNYINIYNNKDEEEGIYSKFDSIICVSEYTKRQFCDLFPQFEHKVKAIYNIIDTEAIKKMSNLFDKLDERFDNSFFTIISVGRIDPVKRFSDIPKIVAEIKKEIDGFKWYIIGGGGEETEFKMLIKNISIYDVADCLIYLGVIDNPYPYIARSNLLISTSKSEACPNSINEAKILHIPVISTNFGSINEFIVEGEQGFITTLDDLGEKIKIMISDHKKYNGIKNKIKSFEYNNQQYLKNIYELL